MPIKGSVKNGKCQLNYGEMSFGKNRGLAVSIEGQADSRIDFQFRPNPHNEDSKYYNKNQAEFYEEAAKELVKKVKEKDGQYTLPKSVEITVNKHDYDVEER